MTQNTLRKIQSMYPRLSDKEKKIADFVLENPEHIIQNTINGVAEQLNVADATVFRFCKRLGFKGYQAMKIALAQEVMTPFQQIHEEIQEGDSEETITSKIFKSNIQTLENTQNILNADALAHAVDMLENATEVYFFGTGGSMVIAMDAYHKFVRTGIKCYSFIDSHFQLMAASQMKPTDVALIVSHSGKNRDTLNIARVVQESGAKFIAITGFPKSNLAQLAEVSLVTSSEETEYRSEALSSRIAQLSLIDALYVNIMVIRKDTSTEAMKKVRHAILNTRI
ncbi:MurR/RpiR family transcriptional regulator [Kurthia massiliensis]|uniref:MurR/RpiR family transcriptional regulator n=1 Tax=Kurthia massiliensis TaxID=1033739 RepID=UPI0002888955|nr:MurR/RpiR family transcriptional regulator [Kurthia massiliensis]